MVGYYFSFVSNLRVKLERHPQKYAESNGIKVKSLYLRWMYLWSEV